MKVIFLHPDVSRNAVSGSALRPEMIRKAFIDRGYEVLNISGTREERAKSFGHLRHRLDKGEKFDYLYVESLTRPMNLRIEGKGFFKRFRREKLDFEIISLTIAKGIPVGFYLRDIHWDFSSETMPDKNLRAKYVAHYLRKYGKRELHYLKNQSIEVFMPSLGFAEYVQSKWGLGGNISRPGSEPKNRQKRIIGDSIKLIYVGGSKGIYDPSLFVKGAENFKQKQFTFCTRKSEWQVVKHDFTGFDLRVIHKSGGELDIEYDSADVGVYLMPPNGYVRLAFGVKLMEYVANGLPILAFKGTEAARFIEESDIGWTVAFDADEVTKILGRILLSKKEYRQKQQNVLDLQKEITWQKVIDRLEKVLLK